MSVLCKTEEIIVDSADYNSDEADDNIRLTLEDSGGESYHHSYSEQNHSRIQLSVSHIIPQGGKSSSKSVMENEKRMRREIANSNERRRMQSINAGFQSLRSLLPHHEGEKLSKAAILQQTSQYIIELEREKTHLLSQNSQLKRNQGQHDIGGGGGGTEINCGAGAIKKRKLTDNVITLQTISDSSDEGLGSMSPEPVTLLNNGTKTGITTTYISTTTKDLAEMKASLESERKRRMIAEERLRQFSRQIYPNHSFVHREVIEHTDNVREEEIALSIINDPLKLQVVEIDALPSVGQTQVVVCSSLEDMQEDDEIVETITDDIIHEDIIHDVMHEDIRDEVIIKDEIAEYVEVPSRLQPILEAAIKAEPKVEVERINATLTKLKDDDKEGGGKPGNSRMYLTSTSRQNLETIVEAIRHLEGDHLFGENPVAEQHKKTVVVQQEVPLALTNKPQQRKQLPAELSPFLQLKKQTNVTIGTVTTIATAPSAISLANAAAKISNSNNNSSSMGTSNNSSNSNTNTTVVGSSSTLKTLQLSTTTSSSSSPSLSASSSTQQSSLTIPSSSSSISVALKQCRPGVIVAKQISS